MTSQVDFPREPQRDHGDYSRMVDAAFLRSESHMRQMVRADWQQAPPLLARWAARLVVRAHDVGVPLYVHCCFRNEREQNILRAKGFSKTSWPFSAHNISEAVDIVHGKFHWELYPREWAILYHWGLEELRKVNAGIPKSQQLVLNWGGDDYTSTDKFRWDPAHWEIADYRVRSRRMRELVPILMSPHKRLADRL